MVSLMLAAKNVAQTASSIAELASTALSQQDRAGDRRDQHQRGGRQDAPRPPGVEPEQGDPAGPLRLAHQQRGDQEARDDEEDVDADEPARERPDPGVVQRHQQHGQGAESLDVLPEAAMHPDRVGSAGDAGRNEEVAYRADSCSRTSSA